MIDGLISNAGVCTKHNIEKMFVGLDTNVEPTCVKCVADATPKLGRLQTAHDPGEKFFNKNAAVSAQPIVEKAVVYGRNDLPQLTLETVVEIAVQNLNQLPMPKDIKQFKAVQKAIKTLESLVEKSNG